MAIYFVVWFLLIIPYLLIPHRNDTKFNRKYAVYIWICLSLLIGLRGMSVGADTVQYAYRYEIVEELIKPGAAERGYSLFSYLFKLLGFSFYAYNFVVACILSGIVAAFYATYSKHIAFSAIIFMTIGLLPMYMSGTRQAMAISICLIAFVLADNRHFVMSVLFVLLASTFHSSAIVCYVAVAFIVCRLRFSRLAIWVLILFVVSAIFLRPQLVCLIEPLIPQKYAKIDLDANYGINPLLIIISILIPLFCVFFDPRVEKDGKYSRQKTWMFVFSCLNALFTILAPSSMYFSRAAFYFRHVNSILIPNTIWNQYTYENRQIMSILISALCIAYFIISIPGGTLRIDQYEFFW